RHGRAARLQNRAAGDHAAALPREPRLSPRRGERSGPREAFRLGDQRGGTELRARCGLEQEERRAGGGDGGARRDRSRASGGAGMTRTLRALLVGLLLAAGAAATAAPMRPLPRSPPPP